MRKDAAKFDRILTLGLVLGQIFCLYGITSKHGHPDQMAFIPLFNENMLPFNPGWFEKPPFHTYFNYFLSVLPISIIGHIFGMPVGVSDSSMKVWSKLLQGFLFLGSITIIYYTTRKSFSIFTARIIALICATSAGFITHSHFLTADIPVMFWMLTAFYFSHRILYENKLSNYLFAGFLTGIATATKYNGLGIGVTLVVAHIITNTAGSWRNFALRQIVFSKRLVLGLVMVLVGFVVGNPFSVLDRRTFINDFIYNYMVAPVYEGQTGHSYGKFFVAIIEIIGLPSFLISLIAVIFSIYWIFRQKKKNHEQETVVLCLTTFLVYYYQFGSFPRIESRFILPIVPLWLIMSGPFWNKLRQYKPAIPSLLLVLLSYNALCSFYVGKRFLDDPRIVAVNWGKHSFEKNRSIEADIYAPSWKEYSDLQIQETVTPFVTGRERLFEYLFPGNTFINGPIKNRIKTDKMINWYSLKELSQRNPDYIVADSLYYQRFVDPGIRSDLYPSMRTYFNNLLSEQYSYHIMFDQESHVVPAWVYPRNIDFLYNRITILARNDITSKY